ncbi:MAG TPA: hydroxymethylglutaryl-CoA synthase, partial [Candidatus Polarisedimenticolia bacterium]|nr:hydroxymethylglutaryl-CoA synthase [Candidatus Polarisedimenticolia bacterium]
GIAGYGAYVPRLRVRTDDISKAWRPRGAVAPAVAEKSVPGPDEDVVTMAIEAARTALDRAAADPDRIGAVWVGTESKPYAVKPSSTLVAEAIGATPWVSAADLEFACKAGSEAMQTACAFVGSGMAGYAMAIGMDAAQSKPGDALEFTAAAGGAAYLFGPAETALAIVEASRSYVTDTPDFFRRQHMHYPEHGHRFTGEPSYFAHSRAAARGLLDSLGRASSAYRFAVFHQPNPKFVRRVAREMGFTEEQIAPGAVVDQIGNTYAGASLLGLAAILDVASAGDRIFFCSYGSGAGSDAFSLVATRHLEGRRAAGPLVSDYLARRHPIEDYGRYLRISGKIRML